MYLLNAFLHSICASILFPKFWIIFNIITPNNVSDRLPISSLCVLFFFFYHTPSSAACLSIFSFCLIYCVWTFHSACRLEGHSSSCLWSLLPVGGVELGPCEDFLVRGTDACFLVGVAASWFSKGKFHAQWYVMGYLCA